MPAHDVLIIGAGLAGQRAAGRQVVLQANPFPYTQGFISVTNPQVTNAHRTVRVRRVRD